ncbi:hypothetical protein ACT2FY_41145 [Paraburkholderia fungorum]|uniref:hypothetical protein n=1 Tax=Paraburkholderia fungorum TaxID=134537 RepID=UPI00402B984E
MNSKRSKAVDPLGRIFRAVSGEVPDAASLARMHQVSSVLDLRDNDALWSIIAVLEYYARLYEAMPERIRWASEGSLEAARREVGGASEALMQQHREALERCKATIQLAQNLIHEHEARYRASLANLNETALTVMIERMTIQVACAAGNRLIGAAALSAREQREQMNNAIGKFGQAVDTAEGRVEAMATRMERRFARSMRRMLVVGGVILCLTVLGASGLAYWGTGCHLAGAHCEAGRSR